MALGPQEFTCSCCRQFPACCRLCTPGLPSPVFAEWQLSLAWQELAVCPLVPPPKSRGIDILGVALDQRRVGIGGLISHHPILHGRILSILMALPRSRPSYPSSNLLIHPWFIAFLLSLSHFPHSFSCTSCGLLPNKPCGQIPVSGCAFGRTKPKRSLFSSLLPKISESGQKKRNIHQKKSVKNDYTYFS